MNDFRWGGRVELFLLHDKPINRNTDASSTLGALRKWQVTSKQLARVSPKLEVKNPSPLECAVGLKVALPKKQYSVGPPIGAEYRKLVRLGNLLKQRRDTWT